MTNLTPSCLLGRISLYPRCRVDGNDVESVYRMTSAAVARARAGQGPSLLECRSFRWRGHVEASSDNDVGVKRRGELTEWMAKDPVARVAARLAACGIVDLEEREINAEIQGALARARKASYPPAEPGEVSCAF